MYTRPAPLPFAYVPLPLSSLVSRDYKRKNEVLANKFWYPIYKVSLINQ